MAARWIAVAIAFSLSTSISGCVSTIAGTAVQSPRPDSADVPLLSESSLDGLLLSDSDINAISGVGMVQFGTSNEFTDFSEQVSDADCLGAAYPAEKYVYAGMGWTSVRIELFVDFGTPNLAHVVEQSLILFDTAEEATEFFQQSRRQWRDCAESWKHVTVDGRPWMPSDVDDIGDMVIAQDAERVERSRCQHALGVWSNLIIESLSCDYRANEEATAIVSRILQRAAKG